MSSLQRLSVNKYRILIIFLFLVQCTIPAIAQEAETLDTLIVTKEVVVSSSRVSQTAELTGRNISIIPAQKIKSMPAHTVDEVLRYASGVEVQSRGAFGAQSDFSIRGSTFSQVLIMIDGMRYNDPLTAHLNSNIPVAPSEIKRIEVLHGPAAAQYGADAVGGVVNIITKTMGQPDAKPQTQADLKAGYGQYNLKMGRGGFMHYGKNYRIGGGGMWFKSPGQTLANNYKNRFNVGNVSLSGGLKLGNGWDLAARSAYDSRNYNAKHFYTASPADQATGDVTSWWNQLRLTKDSDNSRTALEASYKNSVNEYIFNPSTPANHHTTNLLNLQLYQNREFSNQWSLTYGAQTTNRSIDSNDRGNHSDWHYAGFSVLQWQTSSPLTLTGSLRLDRDQSYGTELMPQLSASYDIERWVFRASGGRSIRSPGYTERYISSNLAGPVAAKRNVGNPDLLAERAWSGEAGFDFYASGNIRLSATGFVRKSSNLIDYVLTNSKNIPNDSNLKPNAQYLYSSNLSSVNTAGIESEISIQKKLGQQWLLSTKTGYTFTNIYNNQNPAAKYISSYARHLINGNISLQNGPFKGTISGLWKQRPEDQSNAISAFKSSSYSIWNLKVEYNIYQNLTLGVEVDNLFDKHYQDILGARMPGRWGMASISWQLGK